MSSRYEILEDPKRDAEIGKKLLHKMPKEDFDSIDYLTDRQKEIVVLNLGLFGTKKNTLREIASQLCISAERVRQIVANSCIRVGKNKQEELQEMITKRRKLMQSLKEYYENE